MKPVSNISYSSYVEILFKVHQLASYSYVYASLYIILRSGYNHNYVAKVYSYSYVL